MILELEVTLCLEGFLPGLFRERMFRDIDPSLELVELLFDFPIRLRDLALVKLVKLQGLAKGKKMFGW
jgi:hypothetical protein